MRGLKKGFVFWVFFISLFGSVSASADEVWEVVSGIKEPDIRDLACDLKSNGVFFAAARRTLYRSTDHGSTWQPVFSLRGNSSLINFIGISEGAVFVCTEDGLFKSINGISGWKIFFKGIGDKENNVLHIAFSKDRIYIATGAGLIISKDGGHTWKKDPGEAGNISVKWITVLEDCMYIAAEDGVYRLGETGWKRIFVTTAETSDYDSDETDEAVTALTPVNSIMSDKERLLLATDEGVYVSEDNGENWKGITQAGLLSSKVARLLYKDGLWAATDKGVFVLWEDKTGWQALYKGMTANSITALSVDSKGVIWAAGDKGLYKTRLASPVISAARHIFVWNEKEEMIKNIFSSECSIREVQEAAIEYAEVHPDKINAWREAARRKALLPDVSIGMDRNVTDLYHWEGGSTGTINDDFLRKGKQAIEWDVSLTWDLGDLIWSTDQTSIDVRSKLMVQLRDDVLDEVTRTYFERRRLQIDMLLSPSTDTKARIEQELRVQELTADLDALTGGYFSKY